MKKIIHVSKGFSVAAVLSCVLILLGIVGIAVRGINFGLDFKPGLIEEVRIASPVASISYTGNISVRAEISASELDLVKSAAGAENGTEVFAFSKYPTVKELVEAVNGSLNGGMSASVLDHGDASSYDLFVNTDVSSSLTAGKYYLYNLADNSADINAVRDALSSFDGIAVKELGNSSDRSFQIRIADTGEENSSKTLSNSITKALQDSFGSEKVAVIKTDFIGSQFSTSLVQSAILLVLATLFLIWIYATIRFHWDFALGSVVAIIHDALIVISFVVWTQMEFTTTTLAAILTIVGYSINATVVILDRVRSDMKVREVSNFKELLDFALTETLTRSVVTTVTTLFAVISLYVFTSGNIKDFALALIVGLLSGCYSSIFISSGLISFIRKDWKPAASLKAANVSNN
ncbi:MAG: protein translocase subunit SecF, partial [Treponema sp.]|nr:protein translocase subunit SecF [Treponema sp.]